MKSILLRFTTLALTFTVGVAAIALLGNGRIFSSAKRFSQSQSSSREQRRGIENEEYAVYSALINENTGDENINRPLVIKDQPTAWVGSLEEEKSTFYEDLQKSSSILSSETVDDLRAKNKEAHTFKRRFDIKRQYILVSEKEIEDSQLSRASDSTMTRRRRSSIKRTVAAACAAAGHTCFLLR